jgi:hypothetical protein
MNTADVTLPSFHFDCYRELTWLERAIIGPWFGSGIKETPVADKTSDDRIREIHRALTDPELRPATAQEFRALRMEVTRVEQGSQARHEAHRQDDAQNFTMLGGRIDAFASALTATVKRVDKIEEKQEKRSGTPFPGAYSLSPTATGSVKVDDVMEILADQGERLKAAEAQVAEDREKAARDREDKRIAEAMLEGEQKERARQAREATEAAKDREKAEIKNTRRLKTVLTIGGAVASGLAYLLAHFAHL